MLSFPPFLSRSPPRRLDLFSSPPALFFPPSARRFESLFIFISFGLVCRLAARHRDYRVPGTHLGNSGGPLSSYYQRDDAQHPRQEQGGPYLPTLGVSSSSSSLRLKSSPLLLVLFSFAPRSTPSYPPYLLLSLFPSLFPSPVSVLYVAPAVYLLDSLFHSSRSILLFYLHCISLGFIILVIRALTSLLSSTVEPDRPFPRSLPCPYFLPLGLLTPPISTSFPSLL